MTTTPHNDGDRYGRDEIPRNPNLDPDPTQSADPDAHADLEPGQTPPDSNSATASPPAPPPAKPPKSNTTITVVVLIAVLLVGLVFVGYIAGILG